MPTRSNASDRLFLAFAQTLDLAKASNIISTDQELNSCFDVESMFAIAKRFPSTSVQEFANGLRHLHPETPPEVLSFYLYWFLYLHPEITNDDLDLMQEAGRVTTPSNDYGLIISYQIRRFIRSGETKESKRRLQKYLDLRPQPRLGAYGVFVHSRVTWALGRAYQHLGDFNKARTLILRAHEISCTHRFLTESVEVHNLGALLWASGQYKDALEIHRTARIRAVAKEGKKYDFLVCSYLSAAKCAIDMKATDEAVKELVAAREVLDLQHPVRKELYGYYLLFCGQIEVQRGFVEEAIRVIKMSLEHFQGLDPPHYQGALDAKIELANFALYEKNYRVAMLALRKLFEEAEETKNVDARTKLLLLESYLFVTEDPPHRAYEALLDRLHLMNNPTFLFRALGNLYTYALEFLDERQQAFLLMRIKNLDGALEEDCFKDLYRSYVSERYPYAIENRLARFIDQRRQQGWVLE